MGYRHMVEEAFNLVGFKAGFNTIDSAPITIETSFDRTFPYVFSAKDVREIAERLVKLADEAEARKSKIKVSDIVDGAVFYSGGTAWRKVVRVHEDRFIVVNNKGGIEVPINSAAFVAAVANDNRYTEVKV